MSSGTPRSSSKPPPPKWRSSLSTPKRQRPATAVSIVFAQPEQGSKLGSAIDQLPAVGIDDAASFMSEVSRKRERLNSNASSFMSHAEPGGDGHAQPKDGGDVLRKRSRLNFDVSEHTFSTSPLDKGATVLDEQGSAANPVDLTESPKPMEVILEPSEESTPEPILAQSPPSDTTPLPFPTVTPQGTLRATKPTSSRSSWFGFSRTKGMPDDSPNVQADPAVSTSRELTSVPSSPAVPIRSQAQTSNDVGAAGVTVDLSTSPPSPPVATSPPRNIPASKSQPSQMAFTSVQYTPPDRVLSNSTSISSVDEEVPKHKFPSMDSTTQMLTPQAVVEPQDAKMADRKPSISSLNPSSSRFTLRLPLLGRPKVPLEQAVASVQGDDPRQTEHATTADNETEDSSQSTSTSENAVPVPQTINIVPPTPGKELSTSVQTAQEMIDRTDISSSSSWWGYVGWGRQGPDACDGQKLGGEEDTDSTATATPTSPNDEPHASQPTNVPSAADAPVPPAVEEGAQPQDVLGSEPKIDGDGKPASVFSAETAKSQASAWYSPWAWYPPSTSTLNAVQPSESSAFVDVPKTESEMVKEEALARDQEQSSASAAPEPPTEVESELAPEPSNPLQSSMAENKSGWISFFMSRAATMKAVANEASEQKDENGMEVMEIDDEPDSSVAIEVPVGKIASRTVPKPLSLLSSSPNSPSPTPSSPALKSPTNKSPISVPKSPSKSPVAPSGPQEREPKKSDPPAPPLTDSESIKRDTVRAARSPSPTPSKASKTSTPPSSAKPPAPNLVLPTWADTFHTAPRSFTPPRTASHPKSKLTGALSFVAGALFSNDSGKGGKGKGKAKTKEREQFGTWSANPSTAQDTGPSPGPEILTYGQELPKALDVLGEQLNPYILNGGCRVVVIGVAGWSPGAVTRTLAGGLPSASNKFVNMTVQALEQFAEENNFKFKKITPMPLEGDGTIRKKVSRVYNHLLANEEWMEDLQAADVIFVASHSQGGVVSTHLIDRLIEDGHILTSRSVDTLAKTAAAIAPGGTATIPTAQAQKVCLLALCGIHLGPLRYLKTSSLLQPYFQYVENASARELFEFQDTESKVSKNYISALRNILDHGSKVVYIASLNDQVVPIYSGLFTAASHPRILRALYIDSDAYHSSDFLSKLLILLIRIMNAGLSDRGLLAHLSEATAGTLSGVGHSSAYEEPATYSLAVKYFFMTNDGSNSDAELVMTPFNAVEEQNDYEIPWLLRDMIADNKISHFFAREFAQLRDAFDDWQPKTTILRDVKKKLQPITRLSTTTTLASTSISKL